MTLCYVDLCDAISFKHRQSPQAALELFTHECNNMCTNTILLPYNIHVILSHISSSLGHLFFQVREPALGITYITYITDIPEPIVLDDLQKQGL